MDTVSHEVAFCIIKPDAIERCLVGQILARVEATYMRMMALQERHKSIEWANQHYAHLVGQPFYGELAKFMTVRPIISFNVVAPNAIARMRKLIGATDSREAAPGTIRGDWGHFPIMYNLIHVSDSVEAADRERALFYDIRTDIVQTTAKEEG